MYKLCKTADESSEQLLQLEEKLHAAGLQAAERDIVSRVDELEHNCAEAIEEIMVS